MHCLIKLLCSWKYSLVIWELCSKLYNTANYTMGVHSVRDEACALKCVLETHHLKDAVCRPYPLSPPSPLCKSHPRQSEERMMPCSLKTDLMTKEATSQRRTRQTHVHAATRRMTWAPSRPSLQPQQQSTSPVQDGRLACSFTSQPEDGSWGSQCGSRSGPSIPIKCRATSLEAKAVFYYSWDAKNLPLHDVIKSIRGRPNGSTFIAGLKTLVKQTQWASFLQALEAVVT